MKDRLFYISILLLLFAACTRVTNAQTLDARMKSFFSHSDDNAYKMVSLMAHPFNIYHSGKCEVHGDSVYVAVFASWHGSNSTILIKFHYDGMRFDSIDVLYDNDLAKAFVASNKLKNILIDFWRNHSPSTIGHIEDLFGNLNSISSMQMCLAVLTVLLWDSPYR